MFYVYVCILFIGLFFHVLVSGVIARETHTHLNAFKIENETSEYETDESGGGWKENCRIVGLAC